MSYAIDCSASEIRGFREAIRDNISGLGEIFSAENDGIIFTSYKYGGILGEVHSILMRNAETVESVAYHSLDLISSDKILADQVLNSNKEVLERIYRDIEKAQRAIEDARNRMRAAQASLSQARGAVSSASGDSEAAKKARSAAKQQLSAAQGAVSAAQAALEAETRRLHQLERLRDNAQRAIEELNYFKTQKIERRESEIRYYLTDCKNRKENINYFFKNLAKKYISYTEKMEELDKKAAFAEELVCSINSHLRGASDSSGGSFNRVSVRSADDMRAIAHSLTERLARLEAMASELREYIGSVRSVMQDNVTEKSTEELIKAQKLTLAAISDFDSRAANFRAAANGILKYQKL